MQDPIESVLPQMISSWVGGRKVGWGVRERRGGEDLATRAFSKMFYYLINRITSVRQPYFSIGAFLLDRDVIDALNRISEKNSSVVMEVAWLGFAQECIYYCSEARHTGKSKWTFAKKLKLFIDSVVSFSYVPMRFMSLFGLICTVLGAVYGVYIFVDRLLHSVAVEGWSSLMIAVLMIGGVQMIMLGVLGEYLWRAYDEMRPRPRYVIEKSTISGQGM
jgi:dolichol-phosphate mannosyltransferase